MGFTAADSVFCAPIYRLDLNSFMCEHYTQRIMVLRVYWIRFDPWTPVNYWSLAERDQVVRQEPVSPVPHPYLEYVWTHPNYVDYIRANWDGYHELFGTLFGTDTDEEEEAHVDEDDDGYHELFGTDSEDGD